MATLKQLAVQVAHTFERGTDTIFIERIKFLIINERSMLIHREIDKYGVNEIYIQPYDADLMLVNASELVGYTSTKQLLRSVNKIPTPIRYQGDVPFVFVGSLDRRVSFRYTKGFMMDFTRYLRYIGANIEYFYTNNYLYIPNNIKLEKVRIEAPYNSLDITVTDPTGICVFEDMEFPLAGDLLNTVMTGVINILRSGNDIREKAPTATRDIN